MLVFDLFDPVAQHQSPNFSFWVAIRVSPSSCNISHAKKCTNNTKFKNRFLVRMEQLIEMKPGDINVKFRYFTKLENLQDYPVQSDSFSIVKTSNNYSDILYSNYFISEMRYAPR
ncbi:unnamed protein product [Allacma fusca]|uniref:Uncharacterized protein n=1 Tax=Allacma fusca TaxID=39272 RepID=A0A8J2K165_9HEXA|nr:unnamed protein product [Allacma fusca]